MSGFPVFRPSILLSFDTLLVLESSSTGDLTSSMPFGDPFLFDLTFVELNSGSRFVIHNCCLG